MSKPLISVIIPFGGDGEVIKTLASIKNQKSVATEIIVVTRKFSALNFLDEFRDVRVVQELYPGVYGALNTGLALANGEFCCFLSSGAFFNSNNVLKDYLLILQKNSKASFANAGWIQLRNAAEPSTFRAKKIKRWSHFWSAQPVNIEAICF